ncbi:DUF262 domain-containing protein [Pseudomonas sp. EpS/L25]|uniref:DUF262 domain-containing protein n=1 Tax=Pseudomonas sp. EpS/L25 TaxID=1749078 RepID=UPI000A6B4F6C|nr:DUF262 domain-containing protein [Pseudomonas sp. EpS/L25]
MSTITKQVENQRHEVIVDSYTSTWSELINQYKNEDIKIDPDYQRAFRWTIEQQTRYIESLLLNIPTPPIFFSERDDGSFEVIDGLQRFSTIIKFFAAEIFGYREATSAKESINDIEVPSIMSDAPILTGLKDISRETLPETLLRTLRYSRVQIILLKKESSGLAKFNVFTRLNRAGASLSDQEIRNCSARLFSAGFANLLNDLAKEHHIAQSLNLSAKEAASMGIQECLLRLIAFGHFKPESTRIDEFLDKIMYEASSGKLGSQVKIANKIVETFEVIHDAFPGGEAFRFYKKNKFSGQFSTNLFDIIAVGIYLNLPANKKRESATIKGMIIDLHSQEEAIGLTGAGSNSRAKMIGRINFGKQWFA